MFYLRYLLVGCQLGLLSLFFNTAHAALDEAPASAASSSAPALASVPVLHIPLPQSDSADASSAAPDAQLPGPYEFATPVAVDITTASSGSWHAIENGYLWRLVLSAPDAHNLNLAFSRFDPPNGAKLWIYDENANVGYGPFTQEDRSNKGRLFTPVLDADKLVIELFVPAKSSSTGNHPADGGITVSAVNRGFRDLGSSPDKQGSCNIDTVCSAGDNWRPQIRSVARFSINGTGICTGSLLMNTQTDFKPYFLSAYHCGVTASNDDTLVFYWNYESATCGDLSGGDLSDTQSGSTFRASWQDSDFLLVELDTLPDQHSNAYYSGWDAGLSTPTSAVAIHHPNGDEKAISFENNTLSVTQYLSSSADSTGHHWRVADWDLGTTEPGSSGSCLWDATSGLCVGQLHGGFAACGNNDADWYGQLSSSWNGGGTSATRLKDWLNPQNNNTRSQTGADQPVPGSCGNDSKVVTYSEDWSGSNPLNNWTQTDIINTNNWSVANGYLLGDNLASTSHTVIAMDSGPTLAADSFLRINHEYNFESIYDGGIIEYSTDSGQNWADIDNLGFISSGYVATLSNNNPLGATNALTGLVTAKDTIVDLSSVANSELRIRFAIGTDSSIGTADGFSGWKIGQLEMYSCENIPPVTLISPTSTSSTTTPTYTWLPATDATSYFLWVNDNTGNPIQQTYTAQQANCDDGISNCSVTPTTGVAGTVRWWVQASYATGNGPWGTNNTFTIGTGSPPGAAQLLLPSGAEADPTPTYSWQPDANATWYYVWVNYPGGTIKRWYTAVAAGCDDGTTTCEVTPNITVSGNNTWWVRTWNLHGNGPWSAAKTYTIPTAPNKITLLAPSGNISNPTPVYSWQADSAAAAYYLWVNDSNGNRIKVWITASDAGCAAGTGTCQIGINTAISGNATWWIQGRNSSNQTGPWSDSMTFNVLAVQ